MLSLPQPVLKVKGLWGGAVKGEMEEDLEPGVAQMKGWSD